MTNTRAATQTKMQALLEQGQSVWLDYLRRGMFASGELQSLIDDGLRGMTSNPTIFEQAIAGSSDYDDTLVELARSGHSDLEVFEALAIEDVRTAADFFRLSRNAQPTPSGHSRRIRIRDVSPPSTLSRLQRRNLLLDGAALAEPWRFGRLCGRRWGSTTAASAITTREASPKST